MCYVICIENYFFYVLFELQIGNGLFFTLSSAGQTLKTKFEDKYEREFCVKHRFCDSKGKKYLLLWRLSVYIIYIYIYMKEIRHGIWRIINAENDGLLFSNNIFHPRCFRKQWARIYGQFKHTGYNVISEWRALLLRLYSASPQQRCLRNLQSYYVETRLFAWGFLLTCRYLWHQ